MMPKIAFFSFVFLQICGLTIQAQGFGGSPTYDPVEWSASAEKVNDSIYLLHYKADIEENWHLYSQFNPDGGSLPFRFEFENQNGRYELIGKAIERDTLRAYSDIFGVDEVFWLDEASLSQRIKVMDPKVNLVKSIIKYQVCDEVCINQEFYIVHDLEKGTGKVFTKFITFNAINEEGSTTATTKKTTTPVSKGTAGTINPPKNPDGLWTIFWLAFGGGLLALLTPCVFPMIPMTVGFFTKQSKSKAAGIRNAIIYGLSIIAIYVVLGLLTVGIFGADSLNALSTSVTFNLVFFAVLVVFAISFLGAFEIVLPNSWANKVDRQADRGGLVGIFFMALALAIVSFSCTGPIVGTTLVQAASEGGLAPVIGMLGFSTAIAIPFALFAMFPAWLKSLPKSGGWLNSVKVILGFLELALAFKFLSNADLVLQAHLLEREVFLAIIIAIMIGLALYLFGQIKLPHDSQLHHISVGRVLLGTFTLAFVIYLIPGLWGAPLKLISGFPPPLQYSESPYGVGSSRAGDGTPLAIPDGAELGPHDLIAFTSYEEGLAYGKTVNKPILLDFTGLACINCRRMEERVWSDPKVLNLLKNEVVLVSLYADSQEELPEDEQYISRTTGKRVKTVGNKWSDFQIARYQLNAQPYYVLIDHDEQSLNPPVSYMPDIAAYEGWLKEGINAFKNK